LPLASALARYLGVVLAPELELETVLGMELAPDLELAPLLEMALALALAVSLQKVPVLVMVGHLEATQSFHLHTHLDSLLCRAHTRKAR
jgi:hypothetical protein